MNSKSSSNDKHPVARAYELRLARAMARLGRLETLSRRISWLRLATFLAATGAFLAHAWGERGGIPLAAPIGMFSAVGFVALVIWHRRIARRIERWKHVVAELLDDEI